MTPKRCAIVGLGVRSRLYVDAVARRYGDSHRLVAICDSNPGRLDLLNEELAGSGYGKVPAYLDSDFDRLVKERSPELVIVTTKDCFHDRFIRRAMELGCDVVTEKPMTIDAERCRAIVDTAKRTGRSLRVTFNYRYSPPRTQVKELLMSGVIGRVLSVDFHWQLDTSHGADYFRRWHRNKENSGGLLVHKATHHFDLVNWWLSTRPVEVEARGARSFYRPETASRLGLEPRGERCLGCPASGKCRFFLDIEADRTLKRLYRDQERHDGYFRDRCVFSEAIDIEDTMSLVVRYASGALMSYSLNAFCPKEGYEIRFNGTRGRLEHTTLETSYVSGQEGARVHETIRAGTSIWIYPHFGTPYPVEPWQSTGGHGGGDDAMVDHIFGPGGSDRYGRAADYVQGAWSILTGIAANRSIAAGAPVRVDSLVPGLEEPEFPPMPEW